MGLAKSMRMVVIHSVRSALGARIFEPWKFVIGNSNGMLLYWYNAWRREWVRQAIAGQQRVTGWRAPGGEGSTARRYLRRDGFWGVVRLAVRDTRQAVWELAVPSGTCPLPGDLYCCSLGFWLRNYDLQGV